VSWLKKIFGPKVPRYTDPSTYPLVPKDAAITQEMGNLPKASYKEVRQIVEGWIPKRVLRDREIAMELNCSGLRLRLYRTNGSRSSSTTRKARGSLISRIGTNFR
jgi:hypothetical protein